jgi:hypothetical protein
MFDQSTMPIIIVPQGAEYKAVCRGLTEKQNVISTFTAELYAHLQEKVSLVKGLSCDRVICSAKENRIFSASRCRSANAASCQR